MRRRIFRLFVGAAALGLGLAAVPAGAQLAPTAAVQVTNDPAALRSHSSPQMPSTPRTASW